MKALSTTIIIVVTAVVILVAALVILVIFSGGMKNVTSVTEARNFCITMAQSSCSIAGAMPPTWEIATVAYPGADGKMVASSCKGLPDLGNCGCNPETKTLTNCGF